MTDVKLYWTDDGYFDMNLSADGYPELMENEDVSQDQRAAVACMITQGSVPAASDVGTTFTPTLNTADLTSYLNTVQSMQEMIAKCAAQGNGRTYTPILFNNEDGAVEFRTIRS